MQLKRLLPQLILLRPARSEPMAWTTSLETTGMGYFTGHLWEQVDLPLFLYGKKNACLLNLCNTAPYLVHRQWITIHDLSFLYYKKNHTLLFGFAYRFLLPRLAHRCLHVFTMSLQVKKELMTEFKLRDEQVTVTGNGLPAIYEKAGPVDPEHKEKMILAVGSLSFRKNLQALIDAFAESPLRSVYQLVIAGGTSTTLARTNYSLYPGIVWLDTPDDIALQAYYRRADIFVSLSLYEGFGIPVLEALASGCKVICSDIPVYRELYEGYVYFCDPLNKQAIKENLDLVAHMKAPRIDQNELRLRFSYAHSAQLIAAQITKLNA